MSKITQKQIIESLKQLREIKPRKEWAVLLKSQIFSPSIEVPVKAGEKARFAGLADVFSYLFTPRKLVYSLAAILFLIVGVFSFSKYTIPGDMLFPARKLAEQSQAALSGQTSLKQNVVALNNRVNDLAQAAKDGKTDNIPSAIDEIKTNASELVKNLKSNSVQDPETIKELTTSAKTLADIPGTDLSNNPDVAYIYQTLVKDQINALKNTTLTADQQNALTQAETLYSQGKYEQAFETLLISK